MCGCYVKVFLILSLLVFQWYWLWRSNCGTGFHWDSLLSSLCWSDTGKVFLRDRKACSIRSLWTITYPKFKTFCHLLSLKRKCDYFFTCWFWNSRAVHVRLAIQIEELSQHIQKANHNSKRRCGQKIQKHCRLRKQIFFIMSEQAVLTLIEWKMLIKKRVPLKRLAVCYLSGSQWPGHRSGSDTGSRDGP